MFRHRTHYLLAERRGEIEGVLPLAEVKAISFVSPLLVTLFALWLLRERVSWGSMAIIVGSGRYVAWGHRDRRHEEPGSAIE